LTEIGNPPSHALELAVVVDMGVMNRLHEWWRRRAVGAPRVVHELADARASEVIRDARAYMLVLQKDRDTYKLDVARAKRASLGIGPNAGQGMSAARTKTRQEEENSNK
jgi:hypothetical protein